MVLSAMAVGGGVFESSTVVSLDGTWQFALDPADPATVQMRAAGARTAGTITVPGAWQGQGYGEETTTMYHQYIGVATCKDTCHNTGTHFGRSPPIHHHLTPLFGRSKLPYEPHAAATTTSDAAVRWCY